MTNSNRPPIPSSELWEHIAVMLCTLCGTPPHERDDYGKYHWENFKDEARDIIVTVDKALSTRPQPAKAPAGVGQPLDEKPFLKAWSNGIHKEISRKNPDKTDQQPVEQPMPLAKAQAWPGVRNVELLQIAVNAFCRHNPSGYNFSDRAIEAACKAYHEAAIHEQPVDTSDIAHKLEYAFPQISLSALSDIIEYFRPYLRQPKRESGNEYIVEIITLLKQEAANPTLTTKSFRNYVHKMCELALRNSTQIEVESES